MSADPLLPNLRHSVFAVWHWPRFVWVAVGLMVAYFLSPPVLDHIWLNATLGNSDEKPMPLSVIQLPLYWLSYHVRPVGEFYQLEFDALDSFLLSPGYFEYTHEDEPELPDGVLPGDGE